MKFLRRLSSITLVSCLSVSSGAAVAKVTEQVSNPTSSAQTEPVIIADLFRTIRDGVQTVDQVNQIRLREQRRQEAERRRQELEAAQREATEQQRLEAERRRQYFESLSPEEQKAYIEEQRALQAKHETEANIFMLGVMSLMFGGSSSDTAAEGSPNYLCEVSEFDGTFTSYSTTRDETSGLVKCRPR